MELIEELPKLFKFKQGWCIMWFGEDGWTNYKLKLKFKDAIEFFELQCKQI